MLTYKAGINIAITIQAQMLVSVTELAHFVIWSELCKRPEYVSKNEICLLG